jgi:hypothetical protein
MNMVQTLSRARTLLPHARSIGLHCQIIAAVPAPSTESEGDGETGTEDRPAIDVVVLKLMVAAALLRVVPNLRFLFCLQVV